MKQAAVAATGLVLDPYRCKPFFNRRILNVKAGTVIISLWLKPPDSSDKKRKQSPQSVTYFVLLCDLGVETP